jgi:hypothetical protein
MDDSAMRALNDALTHLNLATAQVERVIRENQYRDAIEPRTPNTTPTGMSGPSRTNNNNDISSNAASSGVFNCGYESAYAAGPLLAQETNNYGSMQPAQVGNPPSSSTSTTPSLVCHEGGWLDLLKSDRKQIAITTIHRGYLNDFQMKSKRMKELFPTAPEMDRVVALNASFQEAKKRVKTHNEANKQKFEDLLFRYFAA